MTLRQEALLAFRELDFSPSKGRGQNFLIHERVIDRIFRLVDVQPTDEILEVGPGLGFVTRRLAAACRTLWAIEVDVSLVNWLRSTAMGASPGLHLIHGDVLEAAFEGFLPARRVKAVANLPYSIATAVLARLLENTSHFSELTVMVQKEVAERLAAEPGKKSYGPLTLLLAIYGRIVEKFTVSPEAFLPRPRVTSTVLHIHVNDAPVVPVDEISFVRRVVRTAFGQRRKTLVNSLSPLVSGRRETVHAVLEKLDIEGRRRAETLNLEEFVRIARALKAATTQPEDEERPRDDATTRQKGS